MRNEGVMLKDKWSRWETASRRKEMDTGLPWRWPGGMCLQVSALGLQWPGGSRGIRWNRVLFRVLGSCVEWQAWKVNLRGYILWVCRIEKSEHFMWGEGNGCWVCDSRGNEWLSLWSRGSSDFVEFHNLLWPALLAIFLREGNENGCSLARKCSCLAEVLASCRDHTCVGWMVNSGQQN